MREGLGVGYWILTGKEPENLLLLMKIYTNYQQLFLLLAIGLYFAFPANGQHLTIFDYRTIDGSNNDLHVANEGKAGSEFKRMTATSYYDKDGQTMMDRGNARQISNQMFQQHSSKPDPRGLSSLIFTYLQFIDHDITFTKQGKEESSPITIPKGDPLFDPFATGNVEIPFTRVGRSENSGGNGSSPRQQINEITSWIDASMVYGSTEERAKWLRSGECGKLKVSPSIHGDLLPCNTTTGNCNDPIDHNAPEMDGERSRNGIPLKVFVAGDIRANEQPGLTALHTLFVREHNRVCDQLRATVGCNDEENYQYARKIVGGKIQAILYNELLPLLGIELEVDKYLQTADGTILNSFATAAFRLGHTMVTESIPMIYGDCNATTAPSIEMLPIHEAFFNPSIIQTEGIVPILSGLEAQTQEATDAKVVSPLRNFLFGAPGAGGLDLTALNIQRGRDHGLPDYNNLRSMFGLRTVRNFSQISEDQGVTATLEDLYEEVGNIDAWVGLLAETPLPNKSVGETLHAILAFQFNALRQADRFYFTRDPLLTLAEKATLSKTTLAEVIHLNTRNQTMQNAFVASGACLPTPIVASNSVECNEVLITYTDEGHLEIQGVANLSYQYSIARDQMGLSSVYKCNMDCGDFLQYDLPAGHYYINVANSKNKTICQTEIEVIPAIANNRLGMYSDLKTTTSISQTLAVYPNPALDQLSIDVGQTLEQPATIFLLNALGQVVQTHQQVESVRTIDVRKLPSGVYQVAAKMEGTNELLHQKVVIQ